MKELGWPVATTAYYKLARLSLKGQNGSPCLNHPANPSLTNSSRTHRAANSVNKTFILDEPYVSDIIPPFQIR